MSDRKYYMFGLKIAGDFGISIAAPVVLFALLGQYLDEKYNTGPWLLIVGFVLAAAISAKLIYKKAKRYGDEYQKMK
ncbi:AtpZ/AtpI family protein [Patescibacteria group bacterium]|nr:MAG: AtpZ/AtpI family protein [Patescibacteria group bacterium]